MAESLNIRLYKDTGRLIISIEDPDASIEQMVCSLLSGIAGKAVQPVPIEGISPAPEVKDTGNPLNQTGFIKPIDAEALIRNENFEGFCKAYSFLIKNKNRLAEPDKRKLIGIMNSYKKAMAARDISMIPDDELRYYLKRGGESVFPVTLHNCVVQQGFLSLDDFLQGSRSNLEEAYKCCFS